MLRHLNFQNAHICGAEDINIFAAFPTSSIYARWFQMALDIFSNNGVAENDLVFISE
jgi:hypothetical protein